MIRIILLVLMMCSVAYAQPSSNVVYPIALGKGGTELNNTMTTVATSGTINNQALTTEKLKFTGTTVTLTGIVSAAKSQRVFIFNGTSSGMTIAHENGSSTAANRITTPQAANYTLPNSQGLWLWYDTVTSRWRFSDIVYTFATPIAVGNSGQVSIPNASGSQTGLLSSSDFTTFTNGLKWAATGNDLYNLNSESVLLVRYDCTSLVTYATCNAQTGTGCTVVNGGNCSDFDGDESGCNAAGGASQCSYSDPVCNGTYFTACTGIYRADDNSGAKLQINSATECFGTAASCASIGTGGGGANCSQQDGCTYTSNTCPDYNSDEESCNNAGCSFTASQDCNIYDGDQTSCEANLDCSWSDPTCSGTIPSTCDGDNSSCTGTATQCSSVVGSTNCTDQDGCTYGVSPAIRAQGDNITTSDGYLEFEKTSAGAPTAGDCDSNDERGRLIIDTTNDRLYVCNGATRLWDYVDLTD